MGHWYRRPKTLNLRPLVRHHRCEFVFDPAGISIDELSELQRSFSHVVAAQRLCIRSEPLPYRDQILIVPQGGGHVPPAARLREGWSAVIVVPEVEVDRRAALAIFFLKQSRYQIGNGAELSHHKWRIPPFVLDLTARPTLVAFQELPPCLVA